MIYLSLSLSLSLGRDQTSLCPQPAISTSIFEDLHLALPALLLQLDTSHAAVCDVAHVALSLLALRLVAMHGLVDGEMALRGSKVGRWCTYARLDRLRACNVCARAVRSARSRMRACCCMWRALRSYAQHVRWLARLTDTTRRDDVRRV